jgi:alkanesulfonate monooxygenase SsuD/methylene tetrahydromethanopterin reductase-like flavin-dependent oxidoreductase (luciferase family)
VSRLAVSPGFGKTFADGIERARLCESLGYHSIWTVQIGDREATVVTSAIAMGTHTIQIGTGVLPMYPRTPAVMAQTAATLDELSGGRFILGLGTSHKMTIETWHGMELSKPLKSMKEYVLAVKAILRGEPFFGDIYKTAFQFIGYEPTRRDMPVFISCLSPRMCELAGEVADGAVLWMCAPNYIKDHVVPAISRGREKAGKSMDGFEIVAAVPVALTEDVKAARDAWRRATTVYWSLPFYRAAIEGGGFGDAIAAFDSGGPAALPDDVVDAFAGIGTEDDAKLGIERYREAGATLPSIGPLPKHDGYAGVEATLKAVIS